VEHLFAWMRDLGFRSVRHRGLRRNALDFALTAAACTFKRSVSLRGT
jgi:transposase, IS5 family